MSIIETLTEGMVHRNMQQEGTALLNKWSQTGLLEGISSDQGKHTMARLLENQARELLRESSSMGAGDVEGFAAVAFPIVRRVFAGLIANELVSVQPMSLPSGLIFFLDFTFSDAIGGSPRLGNTAGDSIYGGDKVGKNIIDGVNLVDGTTKGGFSGPLRDGAVGYAYASPSGRDASYTAFTLDGTIDAADLKRIKFDADLLSITDSTRSIIVCDIKKASITSAAGTPDFQNLSPFVLAKTNLNAAAAGGAFADALANVTDVVQIRRLTSLVSAADAMTSAESIRLVFSVAAASYSADQAVGAIDNTITNTDLTFPVADKLNPGLALGSVNTASNLYALEGSSNIPEIDIKVNSTAITAQTKKLKAKWTPELGQDLNAYHNLDAEVELTSILSEQIALEIDREILADLVNGATAGTFYWSRSPGLFVNRVNWC
jgi:hypothetical protein